MDTKRENTESTSAQADASGTLEGDVTINGSGRMPNDIECANLKINGAGQCDGNVRARRIIVNGGGTFGKKVRAEEMSVNGDASVAEGAGIGALKVKGRMSVGGGLAVHEADVRGDIKVGGDIEADSLTGEGAFNVDGLMNVGTLDIRVWGTSRASEIGGETIRVAGARGLGEALRSLFGEKRLVADSLEGDEVSLEYTTAKVVRGDRVTIGTGCNVELVEYTGTYDRVADSLVGEARKAEA
ncbi:MAG: cytoplasmic protein [Coriobacteriia bacterium]|nr:cytoplasmic protein [Coriobacteriia bacterium]